MPRQAPNPAGASFWCRSDAPSLGTVSNMNPIAPSSGVNRRVLLSTLALLPALSGQLLPVVAPAQTPTADSGLLPSWNDGPVKQAIFDFVRATIDRGSPSYVSPENRIAVFDQDGTLWVEHPIYTQVVYCLEHGYMKPERGKRRRP
jgi:hypothetical protein